MGFCKEELVDWVVGVDRSQTTQLLLRAKQGDAEAIEDLYSRIGSRLLSLIRLRLGSSLMNTLEPEDVAQEVLVRSFAKLERFEKDSSRSFFAWLATITRNVIRDLLDFHQQARRDQRRTLSVNALPNEIVKKHRSALSRMIRDEQWLRLERGLRMLDEPHREIILLRQWEERPFKEIGAVLGKSEDASRMLYSRALAKLTMVLKDV